MLPTTVDRDTYWNSIYHQKLPFWQAALTSIANQYDLSGDGWQRAALGRNVVFLSEQAVIKLGPPSWKGEMGREACALQFVCDQLPVASPRLIGDGTLSGWDYLVQTRLPGTYLNQLWTELDSKERIAIAEQHGRLMAAIHRLPLGDVSSQLQFDWAEMLGEQRQLYFAEMQNSGMDERLLAQVEVYLNEADGLLAAEHSFVLLHGDLTTLNLLVEHQQDRWQITGMIDWGDVKIGPPTHEFISPGVHMYRGDRAALHAWYDGYGLTSEMRTPQLQQVIMARAMLYYADGFAKRIQAVPGALECQDWSSIAQKFWHL